MCLTLEYAPISPNLPRLTTTHCAHEPHTKMASIYPRSPPVPDPRPDQTKGLAHASETDRSRDDAHPRALPEQRALRRSGAGAEQVVRFPPPDLWRPHQSPYNLYVRGRETAASRAKAATLATLKRDLGKEKIGHLDRSRLIDYGKMRAEQGAGPVILGIDIGVIKMIITHAAAVHGLDISPEPVDLARVALKRLGLIGKGTERDRRPHHGRAEPPLPLLR